MTFKTEGEGTSPTFKKRPNEPIECKLNKLNDRLNFYILKNDLLSEIPARFHPLLEAIEEEDSLRYVEAETAKKDEGARDASSLKSSSIVHANPLSMRSSIATHRTTSSQPIQEPVLKNSAAMKASQTTMHTSHATTNMGSKVSATLRADLEVIRGLEGGSFELSFEELEVAFEAAFNAGVAYRQAGDNVRAERFYRRAKDLRPEVRKHF